MVDSIRPAGMGDDPLGQQNSQPAGTNFYAGFDRPTEGVQVNLASDISGGSNIPPSEPTPPVPPVMPETTPSPQNYASPAANQIPAPSFASFAGAGVGSIPSANQAPVAGNHVTYSSNSSATSKSFLLTILGGVVFLVVSAVVTYLIVSNLNNIKLKSEQSSLDSINSELATAKELPKALELPTSATPPASDTTTQEEASETSGTTAEESSTPAEQPAEEPIETPAPTTPVSGGNG